MSEDDLLALIERAVDAVVLIASVGLDEQEDDPNEKVWDSVHPRVWQIRNAQALVADLARLDRRPTLVLKDGVMGCRYGCNLRNYQTHIIHGGDCPHSPGATEAPPDL